MDKYIFMPINHDRYRLEIFQLRIEHISFLFFVISEYSFLLKIFTKLLEIQAFDRTVQKFVTRHFTRC